MAPLAGVALLVGLLGCPPAAETPEQMQARMDQESAAARDAISAANVNFGRWMSTGQYDSAAALFMDQGRVMPPNEPTHVGRDSVRAFLAFGGDWGQWSLTVTTESVVANGPLAIDRGTYAFSFTPGPNAPAGMGPISDAGKYLVHWHLVGGTWLIAEDIWNSDRPLPGAPPAGGS